MDDNKITKCLGIPRSIMDINKTYKDILEERLNLYSSIHIHNRYLRNKFKFLAVGKVFLTKDECNGFSSLDQLPYIEIGLSVLLKKNIASFKECCPYMHVGIIPYANIPRISPNSLLWKRYCDLWIEEFVEYIIASSAPAGSVFEHIKNKSIITILGRLNAYAFNYKHVDGNETSYIISIPHLFQNYKRTS